MGKNLYKKDIWKKSLSIQRDKSDIRSGAMNILIGAIIILVILIFPFAHFIKGNDTIPIWLWGIFGGDIATLIGSIFSPYISAFFNMWNIAEEEYKIQEEEIKKFEEILKIEHLPLMVTKFENKPSLYLTIKNYGKRKLIELEARLGFVYKFCLNNNSEISECGWRIHYNTIENILDQFEIRPDASYSFGTIVSYSDDFSKIKFGKSQNYTDINSSEAIYTVLIKLDGKIEGEEIFKNKVIEADIFVKPSEKLLCFAAYASTEKIISEDFEEKYLVYREKQKTEVRKNKRDKITKKFSLRKIFSKRLIRLF